MEMRAPLSRIHAADNKPCCNCKCGVIPTREGLGIAQRRDDTPGPSVPSMDIVACVHCVSE